MKTAFDGVQHALERLRLSREIILHTPIESDAEYLNKALDQIWGFVTTAMGSLDEVLDILEEQE